MPTRTKTGTAVERLPGMWRKYVRLPHGLTIPSNQDTIDRIDSHLSAFTRASLNDKDAAEHIHWFNRRIARGRYLVKSALNWEQPHIGGGKTNSDKVRGNQWRLVIAWSGFEIFAASYFNRRNGKNGTPLNRQSLTRFIDALSLPDYPVLHPPRRKNAPLDFCNEDDEFQVSDFLHVWGEGRAIECRIPSFYGPESC